MTHNKLYRNFIILQGDEKKHTDSDEKALSGYAKIEAKGDKCKISFYAQNLNEEKQYFIVLICYKKEVKQIVDLGSLSISKGGKGDIVKEYYVDNIAGMDFSYDKISGAAVCSYEDGKIDYIMYGFKNGENVKDDWKKCKFIKSKCDDKEVSNYKVKEINKDKKCDKVKEDKKESYKDNKCKDEEKHKDHKDEDKLKDHKDEDKCKDHKDEDKLKDHKNEDKHDYKKQDDSHEGKLHTEEHDTEKKCDKEKKEKKEIKYSKHCEKNDDHDCNDCCNRGYDKFIANFEEYECKIEEEKEIDPFDFELRGDIGDYFKNIVNGFDEVKNKFKDIRYCKWYDIRIRSIDDMCNTSDYNRYTVIFNPMINYYPYIKKYGHFLIGYKCDNKGNIKYIVYGIPGKKDKDEQPYVGKTGFITWMSEKDKDVGYWLMFYDYKKSMIVVPMK